MAAKKKTKFAYNLPEPFSANQILTDLTGLQWKIGLLIGVGGFGAIYNVIPLKKLSTDSEYVVKIEPFTNGPLFSEMHFYQRCCKKEQIDEWIEEHKIYHNIISLAVPYYIACGNHIQKSKNKYRFLVMEKFGVDLENYFTNLDITEAKLRSLICFLTIRLLYALQYIHDKGYVHSDIKAANIMIGINKTHKNQVFLLDYGLASKYKFEEHSHKSFKKDPRKAHDGTIEFTSLDAHNGTDPSRRSDLEILGYNLIKWLTGSLPWEKMAAKKVPTPDWVAKEKAKYLQNIPLFMKTCFKTQKAPIEIVEYFNYFTKLGYEDIPDYNFLREKLFAKTLREIFKLDYKDDFLCYFTKSFKLNTSNPSTSKSKDISLTSHVSNVPKTLPPCKSKNALNGVNEKITSKTPLLKPRLANSKKNFINKPASPVPKKRFKTFNYCEDGESNSSKESEGKDPDFFKDYRATKTGLKKRRRYD